VYGRIFHINITWGLGVDLTPDENTLMVRKMLTGAQLIGPSPYYLQRQSWDLQGSGSSFIMTSVIAAYGWLPAIGILLVFALLLTFMLIRSRRINHTFGRLLSMGVCILFLVRLADCLLMNTGLTGGLPGALPFISKGNTDYIINSLLIGLFLSVWRRSSFMKDKSIIEAITKDAQNTGGMTVE
jgi:cell division protein FtsW (lipid II flippase)